MGRPLNKKYFGANANNNIKVQFHNGTSSVDGYIVRQKGTNKFQVRAYGSATLYTVRLVDKPSTGVGAIEAGQMNITVKLDNNTDERIVKINGHKVTTAAGAQYGWTFATSASDGKVEIEEAGTSTSAATGADDFDTTD